MRCFAHKLPEGLSDVLLKQENSPLALAGTVLDQGLPLGGYPQAVFSYKEIGFEEEGKNGSIYSSRVFCATDATWLDNELTSIVDFDNLLKRADRFLEQERESLECYDEECRALEQLKKEVV